MSTANKSIKTTIKAGARKTAKATKIPRAAKVANAKLESKHAVLAFASRRVWPD